MEEHEHKKERVNAQRKQSLASQSQASVHTIVSVHRDQSHHSIVSSSKSAKDNKIRRPNKNKRATIAESVFTDKTNDAEKPDTTSMPPPNTSSPAHGILSEKSKVNQANEMKIRKMKIFKQLHKMVKQKTLAASVDALSGYHLRRSVQNAIIGPSPRYKLPIDKLLKRVKQEMMDELPPHIDIHKRCDHQAGFIGGRGVRKEVELIQSVLQKHRRKVQPKWGWDYNKRQKRLLLGYRHRKLEHGWKYFDPIKDLFPRHIKPNNHWPDAVFFFCNSMIVISGGYFFGLSYATQTLLHPLEDVYEYDFYLTNGFKAKRQDSENFWDKYAPMVEAASHNAIMVLLIDLFIMLGFVGVYLADQKLHLVYFLGMLATLSFQLVLTINFQKVLHCDMFISVVSKFLHLIVDNYYEEIEAIDLEGNHVEVTDKATGIGRNASIRTYKAANIMDRAQRSLLCCGVNGPEDYLDKNESIPVSCCTPLWNLNLYCSANFPFDLIEYKAKILNSDDGIGCESTYATICKNADRFLGETAQLLVEFQFALFLISCVALIVQNRQIRQLKRIPHLRISAGSISQSLQASAASAGGGGAGVQALAEATKMTDKQAEQLLKMRHEAGLNRQNSDEGSSSSSSSGDAPVHSVNISDGEDESDENEADLEKKETMNMTPVIDMKVYGIIDDELVDEKVEQKAIKFKDKPKGQAYFVPQKKIARPKYTKLEKGKK